jgi:hypothetical protein
MTLLQQDKGAKEAADYFANTNTVRTTTETTKGKSLIAEAKSKANEKSIYLVTFSHMKSNFSLLFPCKVGGTSLVSDHCAGGSFLA